MKQIVIVSGKGGTGKTTVAAALAHLASRSWSLVLADADVDAANLELLLSPRRQETHEFRSGEVASIDPASCTGCGRCATACRFGAVVRAQTHGAVQSYRVEPGACEGCAACYYACAEGAISLLERHSGQWYVSETRFGPLYHAHLFAGQENSGKLVTRLRQEALARAAEGRADLIVIDGPPGIGCPVIASVSGVDLALLVTEPSLSGIHDLGRILGTARHFRVPSAVVVNKADLNPARTQEIVGFCASQGVPLLGAIPYDLEVIHAMTRGEPVTEKGSGPLMRALRALWQGAEESLLGTP